MTPPQMLSLAYIPLQEDLLPQIMPISAEAYPDSWTEQMFRDELGNHLSRFYVAFDGEMLVGYCGFWLVADEAHITTIAVGLESRQRGYGRRLMEHLLETATNEGATLAALEVRTSNAAAIGLYTSLGFKLVGRRKGYYAKTNEDALMMIKDLG
jgi:ribosomal-protein-alanine N-acetyltransferase